MVFSTAILAGLLLSGIVYTGAAIRTWRRDAVGADHLATALSVAGLGALVLAANAALDAPQMLRASVVVLALALPVPWLVFVLAYTGRSELLGTATVTGLVAVPVLGFLASAVVLGSQLVPGLAVPALDSTTGSAAVAVGALVLVQWAAVLCAGGFALTGSALLVWTVRRYDHLGLTAGVLMAVFGTVTWLSLLFGLQFAVTGPVALPASAAVGFLVGAVAVVGTLGRYHLFQTVPAAGNVGPATVVEELDDVVVVTDEEGTVLQVNIAAERVLDIDGSEVVDTDVANLLDAGLSTVRASETIGVQSAGGRRLFEPAVSTLTDQHGEPLGYAVTLRDVTEREARRQRFTVLNRVLRHNVRNAMTVVQLHAEFLRDRASDEQLAASAEQILSRSEELTSLSNSARELAQSVDASGTDRRVVRLGELTETVLADARRQYPDASFERVLEADTDIETVGTLLERALGNLVENSIEHSDREPPQVELRVTYDPTRTFPVALTVADDGPGIPDQEAAVIEEGTEDALQHGSGLGLWMVRWTVTRLGGELTIEDREPRGTAVTIWLPQQQTVSASTDGADTVG